jgi:hypothetical protein
MKKSFFFLAFIMLFISNTQGQGFFRDRMQQRPNINPLKVGGIVSMSMGGAAAFLGFFIYATGSSSQGSNGSNSSYSENNHNTAIAVMGIGAGLIVVGGVLLIVGGTQSHNKKWGLITPKKNEVGLAYNF